MADWTFDHQTSDGVNIYTIDGFGETTHFDAAHIVKGDMVVATILEPVERNQAGWDEDAWRTTVLEAVEDMGFAREEEDNIEPVYLQFDPDRDDVETVTIREAHPEYEDEYPNLKIMIEVFSDDLFIETDGIDTERSVDNYIDAVYDALEADYPNAAITINRHDATWGLSRRPFVSYDDDEDSARAERLIEDIQMTEAAVYERGDWYVVTEEGIANA